MLTKDFRRLILLLGPVFLLFYITATLFGHAPAIPGTTSVIRWTKSSHNETESHKLPLDLEAIVTVAKEQEKHNHAPVEGKTGDEDGILPPHHVGNIAPAPEGLQMSETSETSEAVPETAKLRYHEIFSVTMSNKKFFNIDFGGGVKAFNPNIIPHPTSENTWIVVAQRVNDNPKSSRYFELTCNAVFQEGVLRCLKTPVNLPIGATPGKGCQGDMDYFDLNIGPHDARVFMGPEGPYITFGSNSLYTCFGWHIQDLRTLIDDFDFTGLAGPGNFRTATELQRPSPWGALEKNWFLFWGTDGQAYAHYEVSPKRTLAQVFGDGSSGPDLAPFAMASDKKCLAKYMPPVTQEYESIHQATNSLQITMCNRSDAGCIPDDTNTFIFTIFQYKSFYQWHSAYEPYVMMFQQQPPFAVYAMSNRPLWIHGRQKPTERERAELFYVTSMSWKSKDRQYHGFLDDELFIAFGIEDKRSAGIDVLARDLLNDLGLCDEGTAEAISSEVDEEGSVVGAISDLTSL